MMADWNDFGAGYWQGIKPFQYTNFKELNILLASTSIEPPITCCSGNFNLTKPHFAVSDYILVNDEFKIIKDNYIPKNMNKDLVKFPTSDHLPIKVQVSYVPEQKQQQPVKLFPPQQQQQPVKLFPPQQQQQPQQNNLTLYKVNTMKTLRKFDNPADPNMSSMPNFKGHTLPVNQNVLVASNKPTNNDFLYIYTFFNGNPISGYIKRIALTKIPVSVYRVNTSKTLRKFDNPADPNMSSMPNFKGAKVPVGTLVIPTTLNPTKNNLVKIMTIINGEAVSGFIRFDAITKLQMITGGNKKKSAKKKSAKKK